MRRLSLPFPLLVTAGANAFNLTLLLVFGDPFGQGLADQGTTRDRPSRWSATLAPPPVDGGAGVALQRAVRSRVVTRSASPCPNGSPNTSSRVRLNAFAPR